MNLGGEPERDDSGLPPVDIEIPDDARELDRDVQAYRREQRALRRRQRRLRLHEPMTRDGVVLPLLACFLVLALISGVLLTVLTAAHNGQGGFPGTAKSPRIAPSHPATGTSSAGASGASVGPRDTPIAVLSKQKLPDQPIVSDGQRVELTSLVSRASLVIALIPANCNCAPSVRRLAGQVQQAGLQMYLVSAANMLSAVKPLHSQAPRAKLAEDVTGALYRDYPPDGLTALLVHPGGQVSKAPLSGAKFILTTQLAELSQAANSARASSPAATTSPR